MRTLAEIEADIAALGRPVFDWTSPARLRESNAAIVVWSGAHPDLAARHDELTREREAVDAAQLAAYRGLRARPTLASTPQPRETDALRGVRAWLAGSAQWCLLVGSVGTGKTVAARWAVSQVAQTGRRALLERAVDVARLSTWDDAGRLDALERANLLALDDIGTEGASEHARTAIRALLDARDRCHELRGGRTIITSNLAGRGELSSWLGERVSDRIKSSYVRVEARGQSMRSEGGTQWTDT